MFCLPLSVVCVRGVLAFGASICATPPSTILAPRENRMPVIPPAPMAAPHAARVAPAVKNDPAMAAAPGQSGIRHLTWPRRLWEQYESQRHQAESHVTAPLTGRADVPPGNPYLIPAVAQFLTKHRELCGQCADGFSPVFTRRSMRRPNRCKSP